jgi:hypothetical protein
MADGKKTRIFLSYAHKDIGLVNDLYDRLKEAGFSPWQDSKDIKAGELWPDALMRAIREAPVFLVCFSHNSVTRRGVIQEEIKETLRMWRQKVDDNIYFIPVRLEECRVPEAMAKFHWVDLFEDGGFSTLTGALRRGLNNLGYIASLRLRPDPIENLSREAVEQMITERGFYDDSLNWTGRGVHHMYEAREINRDRIVIDHTTGLMWQQGGSDEFLGNDKAKEYIKQLKRGKFAGFDDWRLPTLEEVMSLMEAKRNKVSHLYISSLFDERQRDIWTADKISDSAAWIVGFNSGGCDVHGVMGRSYNYVRAVRSPGKQAP